MRDNIIDVKGVSKKFSSRGVQNHALNDVSISLKKGEILGIIGESGSGKSTLLRVISGLLKPDKGEVLFDNKPVIKYGKDLYRNMQMIFQNPRASFDNNYTIGQSFDEIKKHLCMKDKENCTLLDMVGLDREYEFKYPDELSGGECQRAAIARALFVIPEVLLCDEITSALDVCVQQNIIELLVHLSRYHDISMVFVSHDLPLVSTFCDRLVIMEKGRVVESGNIEEILNNPKKEYTRDLLSHVLEI